MLLLYSQLQDILIRGCRHGESPYGAGILVGTQQRKKRHIKHQLGNVPSTYKLQPAEIPVRRDFTGSRAGHLFPVLKQQRLSEWVTTNQADQLDLKQEKGKQQTHCAANTHDPNTKQRNVTWDLNDCLIFKVSDYMGLLMRSFLMFSKHRNLLVIPACMHFLVHLHLSKLPGTRIVSFLLRYNTTKLKSAIRVLTFAVPTHLESTRVEWAMNFDKITSNTGHIPRCQ